MRQSTGKRPFALYFVHTVFVYGLCTVHVQPQSSGCGSVCSAATCIQCTLDTIAPLVSNLSPLVSRKVHLCVCLSSITSDIEEIPLRRLKMATGK